MVFLVSLGIVMVILGCWVFFGNHNELLWVSFDNFLQYLNNEQSDNSSVLFLQPGQLRILCIVLLFQKLQVVDRTQQNLKFRYFLSGIRVGFRLNS